jgi:hypothetical protein
MSAARKRNRTRGAKATRKRTAALLQSHTDTVAHFGRGDQREAIALAVNPNKGKRHAARMTPPPRVSKNQGARARGEIARRPYLETSWPRIPSLPSMLTKQPPTRGDA